jgi:tetratricopeptide (TPR) repeat protein
MNQLNQLTLKSIALLKSNKFVEAENLLDQIIKRFPGDSNAYVNKSLLLINTSSFQKAYQFLSPLKKKFPSSTEIFNASGIVNHKLEFYKEAENDFKKAIELDNKNFNAYINFCNLYIYLKKNKQALNLINQALIINSNHITFNEIKLFLLKKISNEIEIKIQEETLDRVVNINQTFLENQKLCLENLSAINQKIDKSKKDSNLLLEKASTLFKLKKYNETLNSIEEALTLDPKNLKAMEFKIKILINIGDFNAALKFCNDIYTSGNNANIVFYKAQACRFLNKIEDYYNLMNNILPDNLNKENQYEYSKFLLSQNQYEIAWKFFNSRHEVDIYKKYRNQPFKKNNSKKVALLPELGLGDQILFMTTLGDYIKNDIHYDIFLDERLVYIFKKYSIFKGYTNIKFYSECHYSSDEYDQALFLGDTLSFTRPKVSSFENQPKKLIILNKPNRYSNTEIKRIGISWKSKNQKLNKDLSVSNILQSLKNRNAEIVNLQYGDISDLEDISRKQNIDIKLYEEIDKYHHLEELLMIIDSCDLVITSSNLTAHLAGILGKNTILFLPSRDDALWYWQSDENKSKWYPSINIISLDNNNIKDIIKKNDQ